MSMLPTEVSSHPTKRTKKEEDDVNAITMENGTANMIILLSHLIQIVEAIMVVMAMDIHQEVMFHIMEEWNRHHNQEIIINLLHLVRLDKMTEGTEAGRGVLIDLEVVGIEAEEGVMMITTTMITRGIIQQGQEAGVVV